MSRARQTIEKLRAALAASPDNAILREHLAETLLQFGFPEEAETEYQATLDLEPDAVSAKLGLAKSCYQQGKYGRALVILEDLGNVPDAPAEARVLYARVLLRTGEIEEARRHYREATAVGASLVDPDLEEQLAGRPNEARSEAVGAREACS